MATEGDERSLSQLERQAEHTRANLIHTVDELHNRVSPQAIKQEMRAYARDASQDLLHNLERRARENPLQTVAIAAGLAYPVWRFVANIPAPILLIGAGLALNRVGARQGFSRDQGGVTGSVKRTVEDASSQLANKLDSAKEKAAEVAGAVGATVRSRVSELRERAGATINDRPRQPAVPLSTPSVPCRRAYVGPIKPARRPLRAAPTSSAPPLRNRRKPSSRRWRTIPLWWPASACLQVP